MTARSPAAVRPGSRAAPAAGERAARLAAVVPAVALAGLVYLWGVDLPFWDQWDLVAQHGRLYEGRLALADLWAQHNEHRMLFPRLAMLGLGYLSGWNIRWELALNLLLAAGIFLLALRLLRRGGGSPAIRPAIVVPAVSLLVFSPSQWENWSWGFQIAIFLNVAAVVAGFALLASGARRPGRLALAAGCGAVATYSFANGLLFWPLALPLVLLPPRRRLLRGAAWILVSAAAAALFFHRYRLALDPSFRLDEAGSLKLAGGFVSIYLGAPIFFYDGHLAMYGGFLALVAFALLALRAVRAPRGRVVPWIALAGYAIASALMTSMGRLGYGIGEALSSRYVTISNLFWLGFLGLAMSLGGEGADAARSRRRLAIAVAAAALSLLAGAWVGAGRLHEQYRVRGELRAGLQRGEPGLDLAPVHPDPGIVRDRLEILRRHRLSLYRAGQPTPETAREAP